MLETEEEGSSPFKEYFDDLMRRHSSRYSQVQKLIQSETNKLHEEIQLGLYQIRMVDTPIIKRRTSESHEVISLKDMLQLKNEIQSKLTLLSRNLQPQNDRYAQTRRASDRRKHEDFISGMIDANKKLLERKIEKRLRQKELQAQNRVLALFVHSNQTIIPNRLRDNMLDNQFDVLQSRKRQLAELRSIEKPITKDNQTEILTQRKQLRRRYRFKTEIEQYGIPDLFKEYKKIMKQATTPDLINKKNFRVGKSTTLPKNQGAN